MRLGPIHSSVALALALSSSRQAVRPPHLQLLHAAVHTSPPRAPLQLITACSSASGNDSVDEDGPDQLLMAAMAALRGKDPEGARRLVGEARDAYDALPGGPSEEQKQLLGLVGERVDAAVVPGFTKQTAATRPPPPTKEELEPKAEAKARGERQLMEAVRVFGNKVDPTRFGEARRLLEEAREAFRFAGSSVERERDAMMGNLYAVINAEEERNERVKKLVRMKKLLELTKLKRKAETLGVDPEALEAVLSAEGSAQAENAPGEADEADGGGGTDALDEEEDLAGDILEAWKREGVDAEGKEVDELEAKIRDLEDTI